MENKNIIAALVKAQSEIKSPAKSGWNPMYKSNYSTLDDIYVSCRGALAKNGLVLFHSVEYEVCPQSHVGRYYLLTTLLHSSGESIANRFPMFIEKQTNQGIASARTYACRYAIANLLSLPSDEDDDGNVSSSNADQQKQVDQQKQIEELVGEDKELAGRILKGYEKKYKTSVTSFKDIKPEDFAPTIAKLKAKQAAARVS